MSETTISTVRMEAFSDAVIAIILTIMVLELKVPHGTTAAGLQALWPVFLSYVLSFLVLAIYWVNHHQMLRVARHTDNNVLWTNNLLLFWLSLIPFATGFMGENDFAPFPTAVYAAILLACSVSYFILWTAISRQHGSEPGFRERAYGSCRKSYVAMALYAVSVPLAFVHPALTVAIAVLVEAIYFFPNSWLGEGV